MLLEQMKKLYLFGIIFILIISACGDYSNQYSDTGSVVFKIEFEQPSPKPNNPDNQTQNYYATGDVCVDYGIDTITWQIIDSSSSIAASKSYLCSAHQGTISDIPVGSYTFRLNGADANGAVSWRGEKPGVTISSGQTTDGGKIPVTQLSGTTPTAPTGVTATAGSGQVTISWSDVSGATSYNIYYWTTTIRTTILNVTIPYTHTGLTSGTTYYYAVTAVNSYGESSESSQVSGTPTSGGTTSTGGETTTTTDTTAPTDGSLSASAGSSQVSLIWSGFSDASGIASYKLVYSTTSTPSSCSSGTPIYSGTGTSYTHTGLTNGTTYYYRVCATDTAGNVSSGATANATPTVTYQFVTKWGSNGSGDGQFSNPHGVIVDSSGNVYVVDTSNNRIQKFNSSGTFIAKWGSGGSGDGQFNYPYGLAVDSSGNVYVADENNGRIQKFSPQ